MQHHILIIMLCVASTCSMAIPGMPGGGGGSGMMGKFMPDIGKFMKNNPLMGGKASNGTEVNQKRADIIEMLNEMKSFAESPLAKSNTMKKIMDMMAPEPETTAASGVNATSGKPKRTMFDMIESMTKYMPKMLKFMESLSSKGSKTAGKGKGASDITNEIPGFTVDAEKPSSSKSKFNPMSMMSGMSGGSPPEIPSMVKDSPIGDSIPDIAGGSIPDIPGGGSIPGMPGGGSFPGMPSGGSFPGMPGGGSFADMAGGASIPDIPSQAKSYMNGMNFNDMMPMQGMGFGGMDFMNPSGSSGGGGGADFMNFF